MPRTIPETPVVGQRWAEEHSGFWSVYKEWHPSSPDGFWIPKRYRDCIARGLSESDARLLVEGPDRIAVLESRLAVAVAMLREVQWHGIDGRCPTCGRYYHAPDCRLAALIANLEGG